MTLNDREWSVVRKALDDFAKKPYNWTGYSNPEVAFADQAIARDLVLRIR